MTATHEQRFRRAALFVLAGLVVQLVTTLHWTPLTFVIFSMLGAPLVLLGVLLYTLAVLKVLKERKAL